MELHLIRHTKVAVSDAFCFGQSDVELRPEWPNDLISIQLEKDYSAVYSSPLKRCTQLADHFQLDYTVENRLIEMSFGDWELQQWDAIPTEQIQPWYTDFIHVTPPNGENLLVMQRRIRDFLTEIEQKHSGDKVLIITHSGVIRVFLQLIMEFPMENMFRIQPQHGKKMILIREHGLWKWTGMNW